MNSKLQHPRARQALPLRGQMFPLGANTITDLAWNALARIGLNPWNLTRRHCRGDFGELSADQRERNAAAIGAGGRIFSSYTFGTFTVVVVTEADRSSTTIALAGEY